jgi:H/ACA ribonucleoprotein complex subunit 3
MVWLIRKCVECKGYTLKQSKCPHCGVKVRIPHPAKFSPDDKYAKCKGMMRHLQYERDGNSKKEES